MPPMRDPTSLIARHEADMFEYCRRILSETNTGHRSDTFNRLILPLCQPLVEAIGCRMAYDAGVKMNVPTELLALYEVGVIKMDSSWYVEHAGLGRQVQHEMEDRAAGAVWPNLEMWLEMTNAGPYCTAPILSQASWAQFEDSLHCYAVYEVSRVRRMCRLTRWCPLLDYEPYTVGMKLVLSDQA